jgi:hypothetical protein
LRIPTASCRLFKNRLRCSFGLHLLIVVRSLPRRRRPSHSALPIRSEEAGLLQLFFPGKSFDFSILLVSSVSIPRSQSSESRIDHTATTTVSCLSIVVMSKRVQSAAEIA